MFSFKEILERPKVDWHIFVPAILISLAGLVTMNSFTGDQHFFVRQSIWLLISVVVFFIASSVDWNFLKRTRVLVTIYFFIVLLLSALFVLGRVSHGAQSWFNLGAFALQPSDLSKVAVILMLAKYFSRRHIEIANVRHIFVSGVYTFIIFILVFLQPDFGGAIIIFMVWFSMLLLSGISKKHLLLVVAAGAIAGGALWLFIFQPYQKARIITFLNPLSDIHGAGYNAYQSTIAVGSGGILGKGIGQGSQSKLRFLPEYQTDFIFASFAEEWGYIGALLLLSLCFYLLWRIVTNAQNAPNNFEAFFGLGLAVLFTIHIIIHTGMNMGVLPVTGITFPLMSYGGSHLLTEWASLGILSSMKARSLGRRPN